MTDKFGVGICMEEIQKELSKENGEDIPEMLIETLLWNGIQGRIDVTAVKEECIARLVASLRISSEFDWIMGQPKAMRLELG